MTFSIIKHHLRRVDLAATGGAYPKLEKGQKAFTTELNGTKDIDGFLKRIQDNKDDSMKLMMHELTNQLPLDGEKSGSHNLSVVIANFQMTEGVAIQTELLAKTMHGMEEASRLQQAGSMVGKTGHIDNSQKMFPGDSVTYNFDINGKDIPKDATLHGIIVIKDEEGEEVYRKKLDKAVDGENSFTWFGKDKNGKTLASGNYRIEVEAYYTEPGKDIRHPLGVSVEKKGIITKVDTKTGDYYVDGKKIDKTSLIGVSNPDTKELEDEGFSEIKPTEYLGKTVSIKNDTVRYSGEKATIVPFFSDEKVKNATIQIRFSKDGKPAYIAQAKMDLEEGENKFKWNGKATTSIDDIQDLLERKITFGSVSQGSYNYEVWVSTEDEPKARKLEDTKLVHVDGIEEDKSDGETYITSGKERYNVYSVNGIKETVSKPSLETLQREAAGLKGKTVRIADNTVKYEGRPAKIDFKVAPGRLGNDKKIGRITTTITNPKGLVVKTVIMDAAGTEAEINKYKKHYKLLDAASQGKVDWEIGLQNWTDANGTKLINYNLAIATHEADIKGIIDKLNPADLKLRDDVLIPIPQTWDGKNEDNNQVPQGTYNFAMQWEILGPGNNVEIIKEPPDIVLPIAATHIENGQTMLDFENGKTVPLKDILGWV